MNAPTTSTPAPVYSSIADYIPKDREPKLPERYAAARQAPEQATRIDECQSWADKAEALASYAKQANDTKMREMADRIQARAIRRCGQLLKEFEAKGKRTDLEPRNGTGTKSRSEAAAEAGLSKRQKDTALRVANVPDDEFENQVESDSPPTVTELAEQGKKAAPKPIFDLQGRDPAEFNESMHAQGEIEDLAERSRRTSPELLIRGSLPEDAESLKRNARAVIEWLSAVLAEVEGR